jgi:hypothetical protein
MTDDELIARFEAADLAHFPHALHVRTAWCYLRRDPLIVALARFRAALRRFAAAKGAPGRYHETITIAFMLLVADRRREGDTWDRFAARNPDLLQWPCPALGALYGDALDSPAAKEVFVLPDPSRASASDSA